MRLLLFIPAFLYLILLVINLGIFKTTTEINFFWLTSFNIPVVIFVSIFFILYILLLWVGFNFSNLFTNIKTKKLEKEVFDLKSKLLNKQGELLKNIENQFEEVLLKFKTDSDKKLDLYKKENDKIVSNITYEMKTLGDKINKIK
jgi:hypothetical protein